MITENLSTLKIHKLTQAQYNRELEAGNIDPNALYLTSDEGVNIEVDTTLTQSGMAADAKAVGEALTLKANQEFVDEISERIPELDDELKVLGAAADAAAVGEALDIKANKADIPTTLPNPYALTINGESYDGSEAVTVDVTDGKDGLSIFYAAVTAGDVTTINVDHSDVADNEREIVTGSQLLTEDGKLFVVTTISVSGGSSGESSKAYVADLIVDLNSVAASKLSEHNQNTSAHADIREQISQLSSDKADKSGMTLGVHTDGFVYLFVNGIPQGNGLDIKADVIEGDVFGYVDENNVIVLNGSIPEGTYTVKYEMEDGSTVDIGDLVLDNTVYYAVTNSLTNCVSSNGAAQVAEGGSYAATISANSGYALSSIKVTMGGTDISSTAVSGGNISIAVVTGDIVITAVATKATSEPSYTNLLPLSVDADGNDFIGTHENGGDGYEYGYKVSASSGDLKSSDAYVSGFIPLADINDVVRIANIELSGSASINNIVFYDASKTLVYGTTGTEGAFTTLVKVEDGYIWFFAKSWTSSDIAFFRFSCGGITDETIVTVNEEIV